MLFLLSLVSGCSDEDQSEVILEPLLCDVPVVERGTSPVLPDWEMMDVRIVGGVAEDLRKGVWFTGEGPELAKFLGRGERGGKTRMLRIWAPSGTRFAEVNSVIYSAVLSGVPMILFAVRNDDSSHFQIVPMRIYGSHGLGVAGIVMPIRIDQKGRVFQRDEAGEIGRMDLGHFEGWMNLIGSLQDFSPIGIAHFTVYLDEDTNYGQFMTLWSAIIESAIPGKLAIFGDEDFDCFRNWQKLPMDLPRPTPPEGMKWLFLNQLSQVVGVEVGSDDDIFRGWGGAEDFVQVVGESAGVGASHEELKAELGVGFGEW